MYIRENWYIGTNWLLTKVKEVIDEVAIAQNISSKN